MKKFMYSLVVILILIAILLINIKKNDGIINNDINNVYLFYGEGCAYCESLKNYLESLPNEIKDTYNLVEYEVWYNSQNEILMGEFAEYFEEEANGVPYLVIGDQSFIGYSSKYDEEILDAITLLSENNIDIYDLIS